VATAAAAAAAPRHAPLRRRCGFRRRRDVCPGTCCCGARRALPWVAAARGLRARWPQLTLNLARSRSPGRPPSRCAGVTKGFQYKMRFAYSHFPINVTLKKGASLVKDKAAGTKTMKNDIHTVEIRNFLGQSRLRQIALHEGVSVSRTDKVKDEIVLEGNSLEKVAASAALVHESCLIRHKDIRKFLDGLYVSERGVKGATVSLM
jgi:ribosomal protein L6P/L9E